MVPGDIIAVFSLENHVVYLVVLNIDPRAEVFVAGFQPDEEMVFILVLHSEACAVGNGGYAAKVAGRSGGAVAERSAGAGRGRFFSTFASKARNAGVEANGKCSSLGEADLAD